MKRLLIYIAGPFTAPDEPGIMSNVYRAIGASNSVIAKGHHPYCPHLTYYFAVSISNPFGSGLAGQNDRRWIDVDAPWVLLCDAIYIMPTAYETPVGEYPCSDCQASKIGRCGYHLVWKSRGAKHEFEEATKRGKTVYFSLEEIPQAEPWEGQH